jgi:hypothetical protein
MFKTSLLQSEIIALCVTAKTTEELSNECAAVDISLNLSRGTGNALY